MNRREALLALLALPPTARITRAEVKPDDVIVVETNEHITADAADVIAIRMRQVWPDHKCVVLSRGLTLKVVPRSA